MTATIIPPGGWQLLDPGDRDDKTSETALIIRLSQDRIEELRQASKIELVTGTKTVLQYGKSSLNLTIKQEQYTNELYRRSDNNLIHVTNATHRAVLKDVDEALLALQQSQAQIKHQKQASQTHVSLAVVGEPKNRFAAAKRSQQEVDKIERKLGKTASPANTPLLSPATTFHDPTSPKTKAIRHAIVHLLAMRPLLTEDIAAKIRLPTQELKPVLTTLARQQEGKWELSDKLYKELDVWRFKYPKEADRQAAIDHAVRAYDRLRLSKDDKLWQLLLPKAERGKGKVLSRLHLGQSTLPRQTSPVSDHPSSAVNSPRLGSQPAHKTVINRLLSKDPKKARAAEEARDKKRKERLAAEENKEERASKRQATEDKVKKPVESRKRAADDKDDRVVKRQATATTKKAVKSQEFVHSSDEEERMPKSKSKLSRPSDVASKATEPNAKATTSASSKSQTINGKLTPSVKPGAASKAHISPPKTLRPTVPSPLGAARPRVASDVSDRSGISQRRAVAEPPKGLGITTSTRKRHDTVTSMDNGERPKLRKAADAVKESVKHKYIPAESIRKSSLSTSDDTQNSSLLSQDRFDGTSSDSSLSIVDTITFTQGIDLAGKFRDEYYPKYVKLYDDIAGRRQRGEPVGAEETDTLWKMHERLQQMKNEILAASERRHRRGDES